MERYADSKLLYGWQRPHDATIDHDDEYCTSPVHLYTTLQDSLLLEEGANYCRDYARDSRLSVFGIQTTTERIVKDERFMYAL